MSSKPSPLSHPALWLILCAAACHGGGTSPDGGGSDAAPTGPASVGSACTKASDCGGPNPSCATSAITMMLPGGYCTNTGCDLQDSTDTCGDKGICLGVSKVDPTATLCFERCRARGQCERKDYSCMFGGPDGVCLPKDPAANCDPTANPATQCKLPDASVVNGDPNAPCIRSEIDDVGYCQDGTNKQGLDPPCNVGPKNCPTGNNCIYVDTSTFGNTKFFSNDKFKGTVCLAQPTDPNQIKKLGESCIVMQNGSTLLGIYVCADNLMCDPVSQTCQQSCYNGTQTVLPGAKYKNPPTSCPMGKTCNNAFNIAGPNWPGLCL